MPPGTSDGDGAGTPVAQGCLELAVVGTFKRRPGNIFDADPRHAIAFEFKQFGGFVRDFDEPVAVVGAAIIDPHDQRFAV